MKAAGVKRLIAVTGLGAGDSRGHGGFLYDAVAFPLLLKRVYDDKDVQEWIIKSSGLDWTIVRPGLLTNSPATGNTVCSSRQTTGGSAQSAALTSLTFSSGKSTTALSSGARPFSSTRRASWPKQKKRAPSV